MATSVHRSLATMSVCTLLALSAVVFLPEDKQIEIKSSSTSASLPVLTTLAPTESHQSKFPKNDKLSLFDPSSKSCFYEKDKWVCQECNNATGICRILSPRGICPPFVRQEWDFPPRKQSYYNPVSVHDQSYTLTHFDLNATYQQPECSLLNPRCFNLTRCHSKRLTVFTTKHDKSKAYKLVQMVVKKKLVTRVSRPQDACLIILSPDTPLHFLEETGKNHFLWRSNEFPNSHPDRPFHANIGVAATASPSYSNVHIRPNYDMSLALPVRCKAGHVDLGKRRPLVISFKGHINQWKHPYYQHRWLAAEYWEDARDVIVDVMCKPHQNYTLTDESAYGNLLLNSTFGFCPGGGAVSSYRFGEVLSAGGIPVVLPEMVPPFAPELDWSSCVIRVSESRIVDLPRILRAVPTNEVMQRQANCYRLYEKVLSKDDESQFIVAMMLWKTRVKVAVQTMKELDALSKGILHMHY